MIETILISAAFLLGLFCLAHCLLGHRELFLPLPKGLGTYFKNRHSVFISCIALLLLSALTGFAELYSSIQAIKIVGFVLQGLLFIFLIIYAIDTFFADRAGGSSGAVLLVLFAAASAGVIIRAVWSVRVELFFEATVLFLIMLLFERGNESVRSIKAPAMIAVAFTFLAVIAVNALLIMNFSTDQSDEIGNIQLDVIKDELQETITDAESDFLKVAIVTEQHLDSDPTRQTLEEYIKELKSGFQSNESFMNLYIAGRDWHIIPDFDAPSDFHATERVWYIGAQEKPGEVFISEPYKDADTGSMCFTVSTMLSDGETVVGMDLNFNKAQDAILKMTQGHNSTAMIVTSGGLIAGYTDMSLVGLRADEKLPEYRQILQRVTTSNEHGSFRVMLDGRPYMIFSSETSNNWYLILSADTSSLYAESYRQMTVMLSVDLLMLLVVIVFGILSSRSSRRALNALNQNSGRMEDFSSRLKGSASHIQRLGDIRLFREGEDPFALIEQMGESGKELSALADDIDAYSEELKAYAEFHAKKKRILTNSGAEAPSRKIRNGIITAMLVSLAIVLFFCIRVTTNWGSTRMNREADNYENLLDEWVMQHKSILYMFTDVISSQPRLLEDYEGAVRWLKDVASNYPEISLCFMANPYAEHPVIMSNGWEPGEDYRPETRPWYRATELLPDGFSVSAPYLDAQTGTYCITLSRVVYGKSNEFLGIFGINNKQVT